MKSFFEELNEGFENDVDLAESAKIPDIPSDLDESNSVDSDELNMTLQLMQNIDRLSEVQLNKLGAAMYDIFYENVETGTQFESFSKDEIKQMVTELSDEIGVQDVCEVIFDLLGGFGFTAASDASNADNIVDNVISDAAEFIPDSDEDMTALVNDYNHAIEVANAAWVTESDECGSDEKCEECDKCDESFISQLEQALSESDESDEIGGYAELNERPKGFVTATVKAAHRKKRFRGQRFVGQKKAQSSHKAIMTIGRLRALRGKNKAKRIANGSYRASKIYRAKNKSILKKRAAAVAKLKKTGSWSSNSHKGMK